MNEDEETDGGGDGDDMMGFMDDGGNNDADEALVEADDVLPPAVAGPANVSRPLILLS